MKKFILMLVVIAFMASCSNSGHKSQSWHPHSSNKGGKAYKR